MALRTGISSRELLARAAAKGHTNEKQKQLLVEEERMGRIFMGVRQLLTAQGHGGKIIVPLPPNLTNGHRHHITTYKLQKHYIQQLGTLLVARLLPPPPDKPPAVAQITVGYFLANDGDGDNLKARCKWPVDWLVGQGYLSGDKTHQLKWRELEPQIDRAAQRLEFTIEVWTNAGKE